MVYLIFWSVIIVLTVIAELASMQLVSIWFSVGALGALIGSMFGLGFTAQLAIFVLVSAFLLLLTRPLLRKIKIKDIPQMNAARGIGASAVVIEDIDPALGTGRARVNGVDWAAVSANDSCIAKDSIVTIQRIEGAKLIVTEAENSKATKYI